MLASCDTFLYSFPTLNGDCTMKWTLLLAVLYAPLFAQPSSPILPIPQLAQEPVIDGNLSEWKERPQRRRLGYASNNPGSILCLRPRSAQ